MKIKINKTRLINGLINFNVNSAVAACAVGLFQGEQKGYLVTLGFIIAFLLLCIGEKK